MNAIKLTALALIVAGVLGLALGSFSYTQQTHETQIGPIALSVSEQKTINVPLWAGVGAIGAGAALLLFGGKRGGAPALQASAAGIQRRPEEAGCSWQRQELDTTRLRRVWAGVADGRPPTGLAWSQF